MIAHYFKLAFRNILKYKVQSIISTLGLAVGFTCFALANLWIHYEMTYDADHEGADQMYILYKENVFGVNGYSTFIPYPASTLLKNKFPEVEATCAYTRWGMATNLKADGQPAVEVNEMQADSCFMNMFPISILSGSMDFMYSDDKIALTEDVAMRLFGSTDILGKEVKNYNDDTKTICAILSNLNHSSLSFGCWGQGEYFRRWQNDWSNGSFEIIVKLRKGTDPVAFQKKLAELDIKADPRDPRGVFENIQLMPLSKYHYSSINRAKSIKFYYLILFSVAGGLVILCSLFNYLSLFITRMRMRSREIDLRKVCGSSIGGVFMLLFIEYLYIILLSGLVGMALVETALPAFKEMSGVSGNIYGESLLYFAGILLLSLLLLVPFVIRRSHNTTGNRNMLRKVSLAFQLAIGVLVTFCMIVMMKQIYYLTNTDLGWERKGIASINLLYPDKDFDAIVDKIKQFSCTREVVSGHCCLLPKSSGFSQNFDNWDGKEDGTKSVDMLCLWKCENIVSFYGLKLLEGEIIKATETDKIMINESAAKALGMSEPIGKKLYQKNKAYTIVGLIKDFHITAPTEPVQPYTLVAEDILKNAGFSLGKGQIIIKFHDGKWKELKNQIDSIFTHEYPEVRYKLYNTEEEYAGYLKSEDVLIKLLSFVAVICVLIAAFGIFSLVTLSCEQRRKEIAVRKVNGATIKDVLLMFVKEYMLLLLVAATIAFPVGYILMKRWLESYVEQTVINAWIYLTIFVCIAIVIFACIGWRVWQAARQNPAEVIKSE